MVAVIVIDSGHGFRTEAHRKSQPSTSVRLRYQFTRCYVLVIEVGVVYMGVMLILRLLKEELAWARQISSFRLLLLCYVKRLCH